MKIGFRNVGRNDPCPCGSGLKYKKCCLGKDQDLITQYSEKYGIKFKTDKDIERIRECGKLALMILDEVEKIIEPGITTEEINRIVHKLTIDAGAYPAPLNYRGFPKSVCTSVNEVICHGIPGDRVLKEGDIINVDVTPILNGYYADVGKTFFVGRPGPEAQKIVAVAKECLKRGINAAQPGNTIGDIGYAIQSYAESMGCSVVREFVGHGVGNAFHEPPQVPHFGRRGKGIVLLPNMVFTIEPMINLGTHRLRILEDGWTAVTLDGSLSAQFEQTIWITEEGPKSLTPYEL